MRGTLPVTASARSCGALLLFLMLLLPKPARAVGVVLEVGQEEQRWVDPKLLRRLVTLELLDIELPVERAVRAKSQRDRVFVRVRLKDSVVTVDLWYRGEFGGGRRLTGASGAQVIARRIALAAGELTRRLRDYRLANQQRERRRVNKLALESQRQRGLPIYALPSLSPAVVAAQSGQGWRWFGPELGVGLSSANGLECALNLGLLAGVTTTGAAGLAQAFELSIRPGYAWALLPSLHVAVSLNASAFSLHSLGAAHEPVDVLVPKLGTDLKARYKFTKSAEIFVAASVGAFLKDVHFNSLDEAKIPPLGRFWAGLQLGVTLTPRGAW